MIFLEKTEGPFLDVSNRIKKEIDQLSDYILNHKMDLNTWHECNNVLQGRIFNNGLFFPLVNNSQINSWIDVATRIMAELANLL